MERRCAVQVCHDCPGVSNATCPQLGDGRRAGAAEADGSRPLLHPRLPRVRHHRRRSRWPVPAATNRLPIARLDGPDRKLGQLVDTGNPLSESEPDQLLAEEFDLAASSVPGPPLTTYPAANKCGPRGTPAYRTG
jgi:hypothetical protein